MSCMVGDRELSPIGNQFGNLCSFQLENHVAIGISWLYIEKVNSEILIVTNFISNFKVLLANPETCQSLILTWLNLRHL